MTASGLDIVRVARQWIGTPYRHQASCKGAGADCLGLVRGVWREVMGQEPERTPPYTYDWSEAQRREALWAAARRNFIERPRDAALEPGDLLLFRMREGSVAKHLGLIAEVGDFSSFIHAYSGHAVVESPLGLPWRRRLVAHFAFPLEGQ